MRAGGPSLLRCGRISYTNDLPVYAAFDAGAVDCPARLFAAVPTTLNRMLLGGELVVSPVSAFFLAHHTDDFVFLPGLGIGSRVAVRSIYCFSAVHPRQLAGTPVAVTTESSTGRNLFAAICAEFYGFTPSFEESADPFSAYRERGAPCLLIGDKAIDAVLTAQPADAHDVGSLWHDATGGKMIYALWAVRRSLARERNDDVAQLWNALRDAVQWGKRHRDLVIDAAQSTISRPAGFYQDYYQHIEVDADDQSWAGFKRFLGIAAKHGLLTSLPSIDRFERQAARV